MLAPAGVGGDLLRGDLPRQVLNGSPDVVLGALAGLGSDLAGSCCVGFAGESSATAPAAKGADKARIEASSVKRIESTMTATPPTADGR